MTNRKCLACGNEYNAHRCPECARPERSPSSAGSRLSVPGGKPTEIRAEQEMHSCGDPDDLASLRIRLMDAGSGDYIVLDSENWAFSDAEEIRQFAEWLCSIIPSENDEPTDRP